jgi:hypothetical protein
MNIPRKAAADHKPQQWQGSRVDGSCAQAAEAEQSSAQTARIVDQLELVPISSSCEICTPEYIPRDVRARYQPSRQGDGIRAKGLRGVTWPAARSSGQRGGVIDGNEGGERLVTRAPTVARLIMRQPHDPARPLPPMAR